MLEQQRTVYRVRFIDIEYVLLGNCRLLSSVYQWTIKQVIQVTQCHVDNVCYHKPIYIHYLLSIINRTLPKQCLCFGTEALLINKSFIEVKVFVVEPIYYLHILAVARKVWLEPDK